jgi:superfamily I DNA and/or RNA helicase
MDILTELILIKNNETQEFEDKTVKINYIKYEKNNFLVRYTNTNKIYNYNESKVIWLKIHQKIDVSQMIICVEGFPIDNPTCVLDFGEYIKLIYDHQITKIYHKSKISYQNSCLNERQPKVIFEYFKKISEYVNVGTDFENILLKQYEKIIKINENSVLATYLSGNKITAKCNDDILIFPFGFNLSQQKAVKTALGNNISVIEGPPGTGKTQTILNIIANVVAKGETVGVVAGNNSAMSNVQEKLVEHGYRFITALLGNADNQADFFACKQTEIPDIEKWALEQDKHKKIFKQLSSVSNELNILLEYEREIAILKEELSKLALEKVHFEKNFKEHHVPLARISFRRKMSSSAILNFITYYEETVRTKRDNTFTVKVLLFMKYGIYRLQHFQENQLAIINSFKRDYYARAEGERKQKIGFLERKLKNKSYDKLKEEYIELSIKLFQETLYRKYFNQLRGNYAVKSFKKDSDNFRKFVRDYPVVLSTTNSILNSISVNYLFDYLIIDEASQVDLVTASLALACCKNIVIVGDAKQLPQIIAPQIEKISNEIFYDNNIEEPYNYSKQSIIQSLSNLYKEDLPKTLLSEHYRCHPKIIGFCNEKFYNNELIIMTEEKPNDTPLKIYKTTPGNHARRLHSINSNGWYNLRQVEVIKDEIIGNKDKYQDCSGVGIICPYRNQVTATKKCIKYPKIEVDTVHKFQGREKDTIIFSTVVNDINSFVDDANLINVAVSRGVKEFIVVTSNKLFKRHGTNIGDLLRYIEYNSSKDAVVESKKTSVFDLLYSEYSEKLLKVMQSSKHLSEFKSENLMYGVIEDVLTMPEFNSFKCVLHVPLNSIVKDFSILDQDEKKYAQNPWTHVDFLIFNKLDKEAVLAVEVDGYAYHQNDQKQRERDALKDKILQQIDLPVLRVATNESGEREKLIEMLAEIVEESGKIEEGREE